MPEVTQYGKYVVWSVSTGERAERHPVDARAMLATGAWSDVRPEGVEDAPPEGHHPLHDVAIKRLPEALADTKDVEDIRTAMLSDPRSSAGAVYEGRLRDLMGRGVVASGEAGSAEPVVIPRGREAT